MENYDEFEGVILKIEEDIKKANVIYELTDGAIDLMLLINSISMASEMVDRLIGAELGTVWERLLEDTRNCTSKNMEELYEEYCG